MGNLAIVTTWIDLEDILLSEICQTQKDKYCMNSKIVRLTEAESRLVVARGCGEGEMER